MTRVREKNLDDSVVAKIVEVLDGWSGRLTWEALIEAVERREGLRYTRQALHRHERIRLAFAVRKKALSGEDAQPREATSPELQVALDRVARLEAENRRLVAENNALLEQFARWAYNAHTRNLTNEFLNNPLPAVDREQSKQSRSTRKPTVASKTPR
ncbi:MULTISPECIES: hypothetical protein [Paraburkholderia]|jgi:hypothetical protein|uniref:Uncharacterized protein n=1 Tax=Paraburkholderia hospita TaxID=169430 RepID=A0AAN1J4G3_9BURK|nr:hypothetical protein [Paraburkholderia hospita]AUT67236.1 hypothetical protein C2L64_01910 [Paraburkholderia hospita]SEH43602.1 hypothetical protein SAMN05192544_1001524 [Paraburkholderia hospita]